MAAIPKSGTPIVATGSPGFEHGLAGKYAGEAIAAGDVVTINSSGLVMRWTATNKYRGVAAGAAGVGDPVTIYSGVNFHYGSGLTQGAEVYTSTTTAGGLDTATSTNALAVGYVVDGSRIHFYNVFPQP